MANIGKVFKDTYKNKDGKDVAVLILDIRTISIRKKFTISVNKLKWEDGVVGGKLVQNKNDHPDYHIWANFSNRGESIPSEIVGNIKDMVSDNGVKYKKGSIFDPFIQKESIYFTLFAIDKEKKVDPNELYNVIAQPYRKIVPQHNSNDQVATSNYSDDEPPADYYDDMEIPF